MRVAGAAATLVAALLACRPPEPVDYASIGVSATRGGVEVPGTHSACTTLPVLLGSEVEQRWVIAEPLAVVIRADRNEARISFEGTSEPRRVVSTETLESGYLESIDISANGGTYRVTLFSGCRPSADAGTSQ